jgi:hypothetical protein
MIQDKFFGRQNYLSIIEKRVRGLQEDYRQNIAVMGDELVGKTSIIFKFLENFCNNRIILFYLEVRHESREAFCRRFIGVLLYNFLVNSGMPLKEDLPFLLDKSARFIPKTAAKINEILSALNKRKKDNIFVELLSLPELIYLETGKYCVVILDEFINLEKLGFRNVYREWSKLLISQKHTMYIVISSLKYRTKEILSKDLSLLFGNFELITVEPFDLRASENYIEQKLCFLKPDTGLKNFMVHFTGGYPLYLELICEELLKTEGTDLAGILENLLFNSCGVLNQKFFNYIKRFEDTPRANDYISILYLIASGRNRIKDIAHILHKNKKDLSLRINHLLEVDTITRNGDFLMINDRVFGFWLKFVYQEKLHSLTFDARNQKDKFRDNIDGLIRDFCVNSGKSLRERMSELLRLFEDEQIQMEKKKVRLNHFREVKALEFSSRNLKEGLIGRSSDSLWIMAIKTEMLTEEDIAEFSRECRKFSHKLQRKIIIGLGDIDANTRLRALEEKIWAWDLSDLNQMLDLYSKPWVIA